MRPILTPDAPRWAPLLAAAALSLLPLLGATDLSTRYLGSPTPDLYDHVFLFDWFARGLYSGAPWQTYTPLLSGPAGGAIAMPDPIGGILYAIYHLALPRPSAFNAALATAIALGAAAAAWLAGLAGARGPGGALAGALYAGSFYTLAQLHNGETETLQLFALPLALGLMLQARRALMGQAGAGCPFVTSSRAGLGVGLAFLASWYYGAYVVIIGAVGGALTALTLIARRDRRGLRALAVGGACAALTLLPQALALNAALDAGDSLFRMPNVLELLATDYLALGASSADITGLVTPGALSAAVGYLHSGYLGTALLALAAACLYAAPKRARGWAGLALAFFLLALGPHLYAGGQPVMALGAPVELPYLSLSQAVPFFGSMRLPYRCLVVVHLGLAVTCGVGLSALIPWEGLGGWIAAAALTGVIGADVALFGGLAMAPATVDVPSHPAAALIDARGRGLLDLPVRFEGSPARGTYVAQQADHGGWLPYSLMSSGLSRAMAQNPVVVAAAAADSHHQARPMGARPGSAKAQLAARIEAALYERPPPHEDLEAGVAQLRSEGIGFVVVHRARLDGATDDGLRALLNDLLGPPSHHTDEVLIYAL